MANPFRNETELKVGEQTFTLRPDFKALANIEMQAKSISDLVSLPVLPLTFAAIIFYYCANSARPGTFKDVEEAGALIVQAGLVNVNGGIKDLLVGAFLGSEGPESAAGEKALPSSAVSE